MVALLNECGSIEYARGVAKSIAERAVGFASEQPEGDATKSLVAIGQMMLMRTF